MRACSQATSGGVPEPCTTFTECGSPRWLTADTLMAAKSCMLAKALVTVSCRRNMLIGCADLGQLGDGFHTMFCPLQDASSQKWHSRVVFGYCQLAALLKQLLGPAAGS